jgi:hypothetical protein
MQELVIKLLSYYLFWHCHFFALQGFQGADIFSPAQRGICEERLAYGTDISLPLGTSAWANFHPQHANV